MDRLFEALGAVDPITGVALALVLGLVGFIARDQRAAWAEHREDTRMLRAEMSKLGDGLHAQIDSVRKESREDNHLLRAELHSVRDELGARIQRVEERIRRVEEKVDEFRNSQAEVRGRVEEISKGRAVVSRTRQESGRQGGATQPTPHPAE